MHGSSKSQWTHLGADGRDGGKQGLRRAVAVVVVVRVRVVCAEEDDAGVALDVIAIAQRDRVRVRAVHLGKHSTAQHSTGRITAQDQGIFQPPRTRANFTFSSIVFMSPAVCSQTGCCTVAAQDVEKRSKFENGWHVPSDSSQFVPASGSNSTTVHKN